MSAFAVPSPTSWAGSATTSHGPVSGTAGPVWRPAGTAGRWPWARRFAGRSRSHPFRPAPGFIVISELAYYLGADDLTALGQKTLASLRPGGCVVACHWRHPIEACALDGNQVNQRLGECLGLMHLTHLLEADFRLDVWCDDPRSIAQREGFA